MTSTPARVVRPWPMFLGWLLVGALWAAGVAGILTVGILILPIAGLATWFLVKRPGSRSGMPGLIATGGLPFFIIAYLNRSGPGNIAIPTDTGWSHSEESSPWPWLGVGALFIVASVVVFFVKTRRRA